MDTERVIDLLKRRQKIKRMILNIGQADPTQDAMLVNFMATEVTVSGPQFAECRPIIAKSLNGLIYEIERELLLEGVEIK